MAFRFRKVDHEVPGLNTTSTADISFMLLIFFLVTTSMNIDKGFMRQLPSKKPKTEQIVESEVPKGTMITVSITAGDSLNLDGKTATVPDIQKALVALTARAGKQHIVKMEVSRESSYNTFFHVENALVNTYRSLRDKKAEQLYHMHLTDCGQKQQKQIMELLPQRIIETFGEKEAPKQ